MTNKRRNGKGRKKSKLPVSWTKADPPRFCPNPWNNLILELNFTGLTPANFGVIKVSDVVNTIIDQTGINVVTGAWWCLRFCALAAWEMEGNGIEVIINDLDRLGSVAEADEDINVLRSLSDLPARNAWAHVSFLWPRDNRNDTIVNKNQGTLVVAVIKSNNDEGTSKVRVYLRILWRTSTINTPGRFSLEFARGPDGGSL